MGMGNIKTDKSLTHRYVQTFQFQMVTQNCQKNDSFYTTISIWFEPRTNFML